MHEYVGSIHKIILRKNSFTQLLSCDLCILTQ